jgi:uncharacterized protein (TIGR03118 family)
MSTRTVSHFRPTEIRVKRRFRPVLEALEDRQLLSAGFFQQTNLVSDQAGVALIQDPNLVNAWGISLNPAAGAFWVSDNVTGKTTLYRGDVNGSAFTKVALVVTIPSGTSDQGAPTGQVFNGTSDFMIGSAGPAVFIFASQTGEITAWNGSLGTTAQVVAPADGAVYTGLAIGSVGTANFLYAANFINRTIDVFDKDFKPAHLAGSFNDPNIPTSYAPFNIQNLGGKLYVTYAQQDQQDPDEETDHGSGFVDVFDTSGHLLQRLVRGNHLSAPWGLAIAPSDFGPFGGALLVGNFGKGTISAFDVNSGRFLGQLQDAAGKPIVIDGLWGMTFGNGVTAGDKNALYFAAGPDDETHGLFGSLRFVANASASADSGKMAAPSAPAYNSQLSPSKRSTDAQNLPTRSEVRQVSAVSTSVIQHTSSRSTAGLNVTDAAFAKYLPLSHVL